MIGPGVKFKDDDSSLRESFFSPLACYMRFLQSGIARSDRFFFTSRAKEFSCSRILLVFFEGGVLYNVALTRGKMMDGARVVRCLFFR